MMVPGARRAAGSIAVEAPYDGAQIATVEAADMSAVDTALATAQRLYQDRRGWLGDVPITVEIRGAGVAG